MGISSSFVSEQLSFVFLFILHKLGEEFGGVDLKLGV